MKKIKSKAFLSLICSLILFTCTSGLILSFILPDKTVITQNETNGKWLPEGCRWLMTARETPADEVWKSTSDAINTDTRQSLNATVYLCGIIPIKTVDIAVVDGISVVPGGQTVGINLKTDGVLVADTTPINTSDGNRSPGKDAGIKSGDIIKKINGKIMNSTDDVAEAVKNADTTLYIEGVRNQNIIEWNVDTVKDTDGNKRIGLWIRDTVAGIGTVSFYLNDRFAALGHPISDIDTGQFVNANGGNVFSAAIVGIDKGEKGVPGSLKGVFSGEKIGEITQNSQCGIYGIAKEPIGEKIPVGKKEDIRCKEAQIICDIGNGAEKFDIKILRIMPYSEGSKSMVIEVTDSDLLSKTGGIVQGMSGSPIVQNGKLVGAVTHVFVNDPTRGYGIFIENMLSEAEKVK